jgi:hypothetical protein
MLSWSYVHAMLLLFVHLPIVFSKKLRRDFCTIGHLGQGVDSDSLSRQLQLIATIKILQANVW